VTPHRIRSGNSRPRWPARPRRSARHVAVTAQDRVLSPSERPEPTDNRDGILVCHTTHTAFFNSMPKEPEPSCSYSLGGDLGRERPYGSYGDASGPSYGNRPRFLCLATCQAGQRPLTLPNANRAFELLAENVTSAGSEVPPMKTIPSLLVLAVAVDLGQARVISSSWRPTSAPSQNWTSVASSANGSRLVAAATGPIYTSGDSGVTWQLASAPLTNWAAVASQPMAPGWWPRWMAV
jgi:hypothetical protein